MLIKNFGNCNANSVITTIIYIYIYIYAKTSVVNKIGVLLLIRRVV